jgi:hypothetical protein
MVNQEFAAKNWASRKTPGNAKLAGRNSSVVLYLFIELILES